MKQAALVVALLLSSCSRSSSSSSEPVADGNAAFDAAPAASSSLPLDAGSRSATADAATVDAGASLEDAGSDPCARCGPGQMCVLVTKVGGAQRPVGAPVTKSITCEPLPPGCRSCACSELLGNCEVKNGHIRTKVRLSLP